MLFSKFDTSGDIHSPLGIPAVVHEFGGGVRGKSGSSLPPSTKTLPLWNLT